MSHAILISKYSQKLTREDLRDFPCPPATRSFRPIAHYDLATALVEALCRRHIEVRREEYAVQRHGHRLFGVLDLVEDHGDYGFSIGLRTGNDRTMSLQLVAGIRVFVCLNLAFSGDFFALRRKHTSGLSLEVLDPAIDRVQEQYGKIDRFVEELKSRELYDVSAKFLLYEAFVTARVAPLRLLPAAVKYYFHPIHEAFTPRTAWSLYNAVTESIKSLPSPSAFHSAARVGRFFEARFK